MGKFIAHHEGLFLEWSTVVDAPVTFGMPRDEFEAYYRDRYGSDGFRDLAPRLDRAVAKGCSAYDEMSLEDLVGGNRAGPDEVQLSLADVIRFYFIERREPTEADGIVPVPCDDDERGSAVPKPSASRSPASTAAPPCWRSRTVSRRAHRPSG